MQKQVLALSLATFTVLASPFSVLAENATDVKPVVPASSVTSVESEKKTPEVAQTAQQPPAVVEVKVSENSTTTLEGAVSVVKKEMLAPDYLDITRQDTDTAGHSSRKYRAVSVTLKNKHTKHVEIVQAEIANALDEMAIAQAEQQSKQRKKAFAGALMRGATSFLPYAGYAGNYATAYALSGTSHVLNQASYAVDNLPGGGLQISNQFIKKVTNVVVSPNQTFTFKVLVPAGTDPQLKVIFKDLETNRILEM